MSQSTRTMRCQGFELAVETPYAEGHVLLANEAEVLNQTLVENLRNNFASRIRARQDEGEKAGSVYAPDLTELQDEFDEYAASYEFGVRRAGGGSVRTSDPVEREARKMAEKRVKAAIQQKGHMIKDVPKEKLNELVESFYTQHKEVLHEQAQTIIDTQNDLPGLDSLEL